MSVGKCVGGKIRGEWRKMQKSVWGECGGCGKVCWEVGEARKGVRSAEEVRIEVWVEMWRSVRGGGRRCGKCGGDLEKCVGVWGRGDVGRGIWGVWESAGGGERRGMGCVEEVRKCVGVWGKVKRDVGKCVGGRYGRVYGVSMENVEKCFGGGGGRGMRGGGKVKGDVGVCRNVGYGVSVESVLG